MVVDADLLIRLASPDVHERYAACDAASRSRDPDPVLLSAMVERLADVGEIENRDIDYTTYTAVADRAHDVLTAWGSKAQPVLPQLLAMMEGGPPFASALAAAIAARLDPDAVLPRLAARIPGHPQAPAMVRAYAGGIQPANPAHAGHLRMLAAYLGDTVRGVAYAAYSGLDALLGSGRPHPGVVDALRTLEGVPALVGELERRGMTVDYFVGVWCLGVLVGHAEAAEALARIALAKGHDDAADGLVRVGPLLSEAALARVIARIGAPPRPPSGLVRALEAYGARATAAVPALLALLESPPAGEADPVRTAAAASLAAIAPDDAHVRERLVALFVDGDDQQAELAVQVLGGANIPRALVPDLVARLADPDRRMRGLRALTVLGVDAAPALPALPALLARSAPWRQVMAAAKLIEAIGAPALPVLPAVLDLLGTPHQFWALVAIAGIGPAARDGAEVLLEVLRAETVDRREAPGDIDRTLRVLRGLPTL